MMGHPIVWSDAMKYFIDGPLADKLQKDATYNARQVMAVTGVIHERGGQKWITASRSEPTQFVYPARMLAPDKPFVMPDRQPPQAPANVSCANIHEFCRRLAEQSGRKIRLPTAAEWDYAARVGTSNPTFAQKYVDQASDATKPVKSKRPNAWGFYDMVSTGWERVSDSSRQVDREDMVDPQHLPPEDSGRADKKAPHGHFAKGNAGHVLGEVEYIGSDACPPKTYPGVLRFRIVVEIGDSGAGPSHP